MKRFKRTDNETSTDRERFSLDSLAPDQPEEPFVFVDNLSHSRYTNDEELQRVTFPVVHREKSEVVGSVVGLMSEVIKDSSRLNLFMKDEVHVDVGVFNAQGTSA